MKSKLKMGMSLLVFLLAPLFLWAEAGKDVGPDEYYQSALQSYLNGDLDQAIFLDSKALQMNPQNQKAQSLLTVLIGEKDTARNTVIWIGGKPATVEQPKAAEPQAPVTVLKERWVNSPRANSKELAEVESRIQTIAFLLERDSLNQYKELTGAQVQTTRNLVEISSSLKGVKNGYGFLFLIALILSGLAFWNSLKTRQEMKRQSFRGRLDDSHGNAQVVNLR